VNPQPAAAPERHQFAPSCSGERGKYLWAVVVDRGDDAPDVIGPYANSADAKDAAYLIAQQLGGTMVYPKRVRR
jgi:hypothetical protein